MRPDLIGSGRIVFRRGACCSIIWPSPGETLEEASAHVEQALGVALQAGGKHEKFGTYNRLLGLKDGLYLEAIAIDPDAPTPERTRWFDLDRFTGKPRLTNWICRVPDIEASLSVFPDGVGTPIDLTRGALSWRMAVPPTGRLPFDNLFPALIQWQGDLHPAQMLQDSGCSLCAGWSFSTRMRLDLSHASWRTWTGWCSTLGQPRNAGRV